MDTSTPENISSLFQKLSLDIVKMSNTAREVNSPRLAYYVLQNIQASNRQMNRAMSQKWMLVEGILKSEVHDVLLRSITSMVPEERHSSSILISKVASLDIPAKQWPSLFSVLNELMKTEDSLVVKSSIMDTLSLICLELSTVDLDDSQLISIFDAIVVKGMSLSGECCLSATKALFNALQFGVKIFDNPHNGDYLMNVVCEKAFSSKSNTIEIRRAALKCCIFIASNHYGVIMMQKDKMCKVVLDALELSPESEVLRLQAFDFLIAICQNERGVQGDLIQILNPVVIDLLLQVAVLSKDLENSMKIPNILSASRTCLYVVAQKVGKNIQQQILSYVKVKITAPTWTLKEVAVFSIGIMVQAAATTYWGSDEHMKLLSFLVENIDPLFIFFDDKRLRFKATTAWTLVRICESMHRSLDGFFILSEPNLLKLGQVLLGSISHDPPFVARLACKATYYLLTSSMPHALDMPIIIFGLVDCATRNVDDCDLRSSAYGCLSRVLCSCKIGSDVIDSLLVMILDTFQESMLQIQSSDESFHTSLCGVLRGIFLNISTGDLEAGKNILSEHRTQILQLFIRVLGRRNETLFMEAIRSIGALAQASRTDFKDFLPDLLYYLVSSLQIDRQYQVRVTTLEAISAIVIGLNETGGECCNFFMRILLRIQRAAVDSKLTPHILIVMGDIASTIKAGFNDYLPCVMEMLKGAEDVCGEVCDESSESIKFLACNVLKSYCGIMEGFKNSELKEALHLYSAQVGDFMVKVTNGKCRDCRLTKALASAMACAVDVLDFEKSRLMKFLDDEWKKSSDAVLEEAATSILKKLSTGGL